MLLTQTHERPQNTPKNRLTAVVIAQALIFQFLTPFLTKPILSIFRSIKTSFKLFTCDGKIFLIRLSYFMDKTLIVLRQTWSDKSEILTLGIYFQVSDNIVDDSFWHKDSHGWLLNAVLPLWPHVLQAILPSNQSAGENKDNRISFNF
jgi:hypothetical protein